MSRPEAVLGDAEIAELEALLDAVPAPFETLDISALDGFLCGVVVQPVRLAPERWLAHVTDTDGRALPPTHDTRRLRALVLRREAELRRAIDARAWFDPWVFELDDTGSPAVDVDAEHDPAYSWVAGFAAALETFPRGLLALPEAALREPLALLYQHLAADDLEDADALLAEIETLEPPADLAESVEGLVRATLLLADAAAAAAPR